MIKKSLSLFLVLFLILSIFSLCFATGDVLMDLNGNTVSTDNEADNTTSTDVTTDLESSDVTEDSTSDFEYAIPEVSVDTDYENSDEGLSVSNMINIIFIVVGIVLILLGIAIILILK